MAMWTVAGGQQQQQQQELEQQQQLPGWRPLMKIGFLHSILDGMFIELSCCSVVAVVRLDSATGSII